MDFATNNQHKNVKNDLSSTKHEWTWDKKLSTTSIKLSNNNVNVTFHPVYSTGTAVAKGNKPLDAGRHHYWEILMETQIYGTDVMRKSFMINLSNLSATIFRHVSQMIGVGTANAELHNADTIFCALLGRDEQSWGFSYKGYLQHDSKTQMYAATFTKNDLVGVHLDTWSGTLQFFLNRKPLGVAFTRLNNVTLYPLISSTMAQCMMKLTCSCSIPVSLQSICLAVLSPLQKEYLTKMFPGLRYLTENVFADILQKPTDQDNEDDIEFPAEYVILDDFDYALVGLGRKKKKLC